MNVKIDECLVPRELILPAEKHTYTVQHMLILNKQKLKKNIRMLLNVVEG